MQRQPQRQPQLLQLPLQRLRTALHLTEPSLELLNQGLLNRALRRVLPRVDLRAVAKVVPRAALLAGSKEVIVELTSLRTPHLLNCLPTSSQQTCKTETTVTVLRQVDLTGLLSSALSKRPSTPPKIATATPSRAGSRTAPTTPCACLATSRSRSPPSATSRALPLASSRPLLAVPPTTQCS